MEVKTKQEKGSTKVQVGGVDKEIEFIYESIVDSNGDTPDFDSVVSFLLTHDYQKNLPTKQQIEELRVLNPGARRIAEPRSLTRALIYFHAAKNSQEARANAIDSVTNTAESAIDKAIYGVLDTVVKAKFDRVAKAGMAALIGFAEDSRTAVIAALKKLQENSEASEFARNLARENLSLLEE